MRLGSAAFGVGAAAAVGLAFWAGRATVPPEAPVVPATVAVAPPVPDVAAPVPAPAPVAPPPIATVAAPAGPRPPSVGEAVILRCPVSSRVLYVTGLAWYREFARALAAGDEGGLGDMIVAEHMASLPGGTRATLEAVYGAGEQAEHTVARVRVVGGPRDGTTAYLPATWAHAADD